MIDTQPIEMLSSEDLPGADAPPRGKSRRGRRELPLLAGQLVLYPHVVVPMTLNDAFSRALSDGDFDNQEIVVATLKDGEELDRSKPVLPQVYQIATVASVLKSLRTPDGQYRVLVHGIRRTRIAGVRRRRAVPFARIAPFEESHRERDRGEAITRLALATLEHVIDLGNIPSEVMQTARALSNPGRLADLIASHIKLRLEQQMEILSEADGVARLEKTYAMLVREEKVLEISTSVQSRARSEIEQTQREFFLREQMRHIRNELGDRMDVPDELDELREKLQARTMPDAVREVADRELGRLERINVTSPEYTVSRTYLDWLLTVPWTERSETISDLVYARRVLDEDHYDLVEVKDRILEYLAVIKLTEGLRAPLLCLVGPPGTGKTSLGKSVARATGRPFHRFSLGGMHDEAEIRGHRRTYIGAMPGRIIKAMKQSGVVNPVIMLDEVDKIGSDFRGDPASALLEVLDPEQNASFIDNYLDVPYDLSQVLFITTANTLDTIPPPLRDRMEVIRLGGYTESEKLEIARRYIVPRQLEANGLGKSSVRLSPAALRGIVGSYTREAGVRELDRMVGQVCRKVARGVAEGKRGAVRVTPAGLTQYLGPPRYIDELSKRPWRPGIATALAWTPFGGELLFIEVNRVAGEGKLSLTGQLGEVMKESAAAALSFLQSHAAHLGVDLDAFKKHDLHIHLPAGATPKDGPSAGIAMATAIASELMGVEVDRRLAMTGEITLKGLVLPIGGLKEKSLAAARAGLKRLLVPELNRPDVEKIPDEVKQKLEIVFVSNMIEVLQHALPGFRPSTRRAARRRRAGAAAALPVGSTPATPAGK